MGCAEFQVKRPSADITLPDHHHVDPDHHHVVPDHHRPIDRDPFATAGIRCRIER